MKVESLLKNEGINIVRELNTKEISTIAKDISIKLCLAFPEHNLSRTSLYEAFSSIKMYLAILPNDFSGAKYILENNSIYFNNDLPFEDIPNTAMHECIHFIQHYNSPSKFGLYNSLKGLALNEAAVQLMASEANMHNIVEVKYFDVSLKTNSPDFYPLECALLNQVTYFTGTYPLFNSVLFSNDIFKHTFITKYNKKMYYNIIKRLDNILNLETELNSYIEELSYATNSKTIENLNKFIDYKKQKITTLFFQTQNYIIKHCFNYEFNNIRNLDDIHKFKNKLYDFKDIIGSNSNYTFYNDFYRSMMNLLETKKEQIKTNGSIDLLSPSCTSLMIIDKNKNKLAFAKIFFRKLKELFKSEVNKDYINE
ncbi:MAG: hypothetical protein ACI4VP_00270 [Clostridia bacterium]